MIYALIAPELMVTWALHQYLSAREIARKYNTEILQCNILFLDDVLPTYDISPRPPPQIFEI